MTLATSVRALAGASLFALGTVLAWGPQPARAQGFAGTGVVDFGTATIDAATPGVTNVNLPNTSPRATITWTPTDTATGGGPIDFLPNGNIANFTGDAGASGPYTVLNRIIPADPSRSVAFNGMVNSASNVRVFFYSPGGLLIGNTARFNVGGLLLSTSDLILDGANDFMPVQDQFSVAGVVGSMSAIEIQAGAQIRAESAGQSNYIVAVAPRIQQDGLASARGSVALVAAESANFAIDNQGLFNISVSQGSEVTNNTFSHSGTTGGPDAAAVGEFRRVYMVAVPKNNAISMAIQSGGSIGFDIAGAANLVGNTIVLSAGHNIADTGTGNPIVATPAGSGTGEITVSRGSYTSNTYVQSTTNATVTDTIIGGTADINFASNLSVRAASGATVRAAQGHVAIAGDVVVSADAPTNGFAGLATLAVDGVGTSLTAGNAVVSASNTNTSNPITFAGTGQITSAGGTITIANDIVIKAFAQGVDASEGGTGGSAFGGAALVNATDGGAIMSAAGDISIDVRAIGGAGGNNSGDRGGDAQGGNARIETIGSASLISAANGILVDAGAAAGFAGMTDGSGGSATGGTAELLATGGTISVTSNFGTGIELFADGVGGRGGAGGNGRGGFGLVTADSATISTNGDYGLRIDASALGGDASASLGSAGSAVGGTINASTRGATARIETNIGASGRFFGIELDGSAIGGNATASGTNGGNAVGGDILLAVTGAGQQIRDGSATGSALSGDAVAGSAGGGVGAGGNADGGHVRVEISGGSYSAPSGGASLMADAQGGAGSVVGEGRARGGKAEFAVRGTSTLASDLNLVANATALDGDVGGDAFGGRASVTVIGNVLTVNGQTLVSADATGGSAALADGGSAVGGTAEFIASNGALALFNGTVNFGATVVAGNGSAAGGNATAGDVITRSDGGASLALGAGSGNVIVRSIVQAGVGDSSGTEFGRNALLETKSGGRINLGMNPFGNPGELTLAGNISSPAALNLTASSELDVVVNSPIANAADGSSIVLRADAGGSGVGNIYFQGAGGSIALTGANATVDLYHNPANFGTPTDFSAFVVAGRVTNYQLVHNAAQLQSINNYLNQNYALARDVDLGALASANGGTGFQPIGTDALGNVIDGSGFTGNFDGQGFTIRNLYINRATNDVGLFGRVTGSTLRNVILTDGSVTSAGSNIGALVGTLENATIANAHSSVNVFASIGGDVGGLVGHVGTTSAVTDSSTSATVSNIGGQFSTGGLVGYNGGIVQRSWATGNVTLDGSVRGVGGLVGFNDGNIDQSYATGSVTGGTNILGVGGLVGYIRSGTVSRSYAVGDVSGTTSVGGFVGYVEAAGSVSQSYSSGAVIGISDFGGFGGTNEGSITNSYWDSFTSGRSNGFGTDVGAITNLNPVTGDPSQSGAPNYAFNPEAYINFNSADWTTFGGESRPIGTWEITRPEYGLYTIRSAHQLQFVQNDLAGNYRLAFDINAFELQRGGTVLGPGGLMPIGDGVTPFTGQFDGAGHVVSSIFINRPSGNLGLFGTTNGTIRDLGLVGITIFGGSNRVGALAGTNNGLISGSFATGLINSMAVATGGLVGDNNNTGAITQSYASVDVSGTNTVGGLAGINAGTINFSFANGPVSGPNAGGLVGTNAVLATVNDSYWDTQTSGRVGACGTDDGTNCGAAVGLTTAQSMQASSFSGFPIDTVGGQNAIWRIYEGASTPLLKAFLRPLPLSPGSVTQVYDTRAPFLPAVPAYADPARIFGSPTVAGLNSNVGTYVVSYVDGLTSNQLGYDLFAGPPGTLTITPALLTVNADMATRVYGDADPNFSYNAIGLLGSDMLSGSLGSTANILSNVGIYDITLGTLANPNYAISFNTNSLTIVPRSLSVTADAAIRLYGDANPAFTFNAIGLVNGDMLTGALNSLATTTSSVGTFSIDQGTLAASANYALIYNGANLDIVARPITVTGDTLLRVYGDANPALTFTVSGAGLVNGDLLMGALETLAAPTSNVGAYAVTQGTLTASPNYAVTYVDGVIDVTPRQLSVIADAAARIYGDANPAFNFNATGLVNGDTLTGALDSLATTTSNVGSYVIDQGTLSAGANYAIAYVGDNLVVTPRLLSVTADAATRLYGDANPAFTFNANGLVNGDVLTGALSSLATVTSNVGAFAINQGSLSASANYVLGYTGASLSVTPRSLSVTADAASRIYGDANPAFTFTATGLVNGDMLSGTLDSLATVTSNVGTYAIGQGSLAASANYVVNYSTGSLNVTPRLLGVTADAATRIYGDANPALTFRSTGLVNGDTLTGGLSTSASLISNVGGYAIDKGTLAASSNYVVNYTAATLNVTPRALSIAADAQRRLVGEANPALTFTVGGKGLVNGDVLTGGLSTPADVASPVGNYAIGQGSVAATPNYAVNFVGANLTVSPCEGAANCGPPPAVMAAVMEVVTQIGGDVQQQSEEAEATEESKEETEAQSTADPKVLINSVIDTSAVNKPIPVREPVAGAGNSTLWIPGGPE